MIPKQKATSCLTDQRQWFIFFTGRLVLCVWVLRTEILIIDFVSAFELYGAFPHRIRVYGLQILTIQIKQGTNSPSP